MYKVFDNIVAWDIVDVRCKNVFDKLITNIDKLQKCKITPLRSQKVIGLDRDYRIYTVGIGKAA